MTSDDHSCNLRLKIYFCERVGRKKKMAKSPTESASSLSLALNETGTLNDEDDIGFNKNRVVMAFFSLVYEINKLRICNQYYYFFQWIVTIVQISVTSFWPLFSDLSNPSIFNDVIGNIYSIVSFSRYSDLLTHKIPRLTIIFAVNLLIFLWLMFAMLYILSHNRNSKIITYLSAIIFHIVIYIFYVPTVATFGTSISLLERKGAVEIVAFIGLFIVFAFSSFLIYFSNISFCYLHSPNKALFTSYDGFGFVFIFITVAYQIIASHISIIINQWVMVVFVCIHVLLSAFMVMYSLQFPYVYLVANVMVCSFFTSTIINDLLTILYIFDINYPQYLRIIIPIIAFLIFCIVYGLIFNSIQKKHREIMNDEALSSKDTAVEYLDSLNINSLFSAIKFIRIGFSINSKYIFDGTITLNLANKFDNLYLWYFSASLFSFIPGECDNFSIALEKIKSHKIKGLAYNIRTLHLIRIYQYRNFNITVEYDKTFQKLQTVTATAISCIKKFWLYIAQIEGSHSSICNHDSNNNLPSAEVNSNDFESSEALSNLDTTGSTNASKTNSVNGENNPNQDSDNETLMNSKNNFNVSIKTLCTVANIISSASDFSSEILLVHPTEKSFIELLSIFQIECMGKIEKGIQTQIHSETVQKENNEIDPLFRTFIITKPDLLKNGVVNNNGYISSENEMDNNSEVIYNDDFTEGFSEIEKREDDQFEWSSHRIQIGRATFHFRPSHIKLFLFLSLFALICWLVCLSIGIYLTLLIFPRYNSSFERSIDVILLQDTFSLSQISIILEFAKHENLLFSEQLYNETLDPDILINEYLNIFPFDIFLSLNLHTDTAQTAFFNFIVDLSLIQAMPDEYSTVINIINNYSLEKSYCIYDDASNELHISSQNISLKSAFVNLIWYQQSFDGSNSSLSNKIACELNRLNLILPSSILHAVYALDTTIHQRLNKDTRKMNIYISVYCVVSILLCTPLVLTPSFLIMREINFAIKALTSVSQEGALQASSSLSKLDSRHNKMNSRFLNMTRFINKLKYDNLLLPNDLFLQNKRNRFSTSIIVSRFLPYVLLIVVILLGAIPYPIIINAIDNVADYQIKEHFGALRLPLCSELLATVMLKILHRNTPLSYMETQWLDNNITLLKSLISTYHENYINEIVSKYDLQNDIHYSSDFSCTGVNTMSANQSSTHSLLDNQHHICSGLSTMIPQFLSMIDMANNNNYMFNSVDFIDLLHFASTELHNSLTNSIILDQQIQEKITEDGKLASVCLLAIAIILLVLAFIIILYFNNIHMYILKIAMILIRHIPPPALADSQQLISLLMKQKKKDFKKPVSVYEIVFHHVSTPIICVGDGFLIESVNAAFANTFGLDHKMLVGHPLSFVIPTPDSGEINLSYEEQGAYHLFEKMELMQSNTSIESATYQTLCICQDEYVSAKSTAYPVRDNSGDIANYVVFIEDRRKLIEEEKKLEGLKHICETLMNQLIPQDIANFTSGKRDFAFVTKKATLMAVKIHCLPDIKIKRFGNIISKIEAITRKNPPFFIIKTIYNTLYLAGGLFQDGDIMLQTNAALSLAQSLKIKLAEMIRLNDSNNPEKKRFGISISIGGPILSAVIGIDNKSLQVSGSIINDIAEMASVAPRNQIIISEDFKQALLESHPGIDISKTGPDVFGHPTYIL